MIKKIYYLFIISGILSCKEQDVQRYREGYLLVKEVHIVNTSRTQDYPVFPFYQYQEDSSVVNYNYDVAGKLTDINRFGDQVAYSVYEADLGSMSKPYVVARYTGNYGPMISYYCDENKRVIREVSSYGSESRYFYNDSGLIEMQVRTGEVHAPDTTWYSYNLEIKNGKILKGSYSVELTNYKQTGMFEWKRGSNSKGNYVFDENIEIKGWVEYPFNFGLRHNKALRSSSYTSENFTVYTTYDYDLDLNELITERRTTSMENKNTQTQSSTRYSYLKL